MCIDKLELRHIKDNDCQDLYDWRNHPLVRKNSFNTEVFSFDEHQQWFNKKIKSPETAIYIGCCDRLKIGVIRFEEEQESVKVSVMVDPDHIGKGFGAKLIELGVKEFQKKNGAEKRIVAEIKEDNEASVKAFEKAGFQKNHATLCLRIKG